MLSSTNELLHTARRNAYAIGAFNVYNLEGVRAGCATSLLKSPAMLQLHPSALKYGGSPLVTLCLEAIAAMQVVVSEKLQIFGVSKAHLHG